MSFSTMLKIPNRLLNKYPKNSTCNFFKLEISNKLKKFIKDSTKKSLAIKIKNNYQKI